MLRLSGPVRLTLRTPLALVTRVATTPLAVAHGRITWSNIWVRAGTVSPLTT
jgi:hypothetical protein